MSYDLWLEKGPVDRLTEAEVEEGTCLDCGHDHTERGGGTDSYLPEYDHSDICDCETLRLPPSDEDRAADEADRRYHERKEDADLQSGPD